MSQTILAELGVRHLYAALRAGIVSILLSPAVQKIDFAAESVRVNGDKYKRLADKIHAGHVQVVVDPDRTKADNAVAEYNRDTDTITLSSFFLTTLFEKRVVVHELTHAVIDDMNLPPSRGLHYTENEGIAAIADHVFVRNSGGTRADAGRRPYFLIADDIAQNVLKARGTYVVTQDEIRRLRNAVGQDSVYGKMGIRGHVYSGNGIP